MTVATSDANFMYMHDVGMPLMSSYFPRSSIASIGFCVK